MKLLLTTQPVIPAIETPEDGVYGCIYNRDSNGIWTFKHIRIISGETETDTALFAFHNPLFGMQRVLSVASQELLTEVLFVPGTLDTELLRNMVSDKYTFEVVDKPQTFPVALD